MPPIPKTTNMCEKCSIRFKWEHSTRNLCWWCEGKPKTTRIGTTTKGKGATT